MQFASTRNAKYTVSGVRAIVDGPAPDGGLYLPQTFPAFPMEHLYGMSTEDIVTWILHAFFDEFPAETCRRMVRAAYGTNFPGGDIAPLTFAGDVSVLELFHGPTCAFKDVALCLLPHLLKEAARLCGVEEDICILTATSGDTGSAALYGFSGVPGVHIAVFYPEGGVSPIQQRQMVTCPGKNTAVFAVRGNFDEAQSAVKAILADPPRLPGVRFSSANSINVGRLIPQISYYFKAYRDLCRRGKITPGARVNFVVPTGNFGDILAGDFARRMGLPVGRLVCASNENRVLTDFFRTGIYDRRRAFHLTASPSMDILISSNLERLLALTFGAERTATLMRELGGQGFYTLTPEELARLRPMFSAGYATDEETLSTICRVFEKNGYLADPHTAVAMTVFASWHTSEEGNDDPTVVLSTASPYKFTGNVLRALGEDAGAGDFSDMERLARRSGTKAPAVLTGLEHVPVHHTGVTEISAMRGAVVRFLAGEEEKC